MSKHRPGAVALRALRALRPPPLLAVAGALFTSLLEIKDDALRAAVLAIASLVLGAYVTLTILAGGRQDKPQQQDKPKAPHT